MTTQEITAAGRELNISITRMTEHDLLEVVEIEEASGLSPWGWEAYHKELQSPEHVVMLVARIHAIGNDRNKDKSIGGFIVSRLAADELHVNNVAVRREFQQRGIAGRLLESVLEW